MKQTEAHRILRAKGFRFHRFMRHGELWIDDFGKLVGISRRSTGQEWRGKDFLRNLEKVVKSRPTPVVAPQEEMEVKEVNQVKNWIEVKQESEPMRASLGELVKPALKPTPAALELAKKPLVLPSVDGHRRSLVSPNGVGKEVESPKPAPSPEKREKKGRTGMARRRFDGVMRAKVMNRVAELGRAGLGASMMLPALQREGFRMSNGDPLERRTVEVYLRQLRMAGQLEFQNEVPNPPPRQPVVVAPPEPEKKPEPVVAAPPPPPPPAPVQQQVAAPVTPQASQKPPEAVISIITDPQLTDRQKIRMLQGFWEL